LELSWKGFVDYLFEHMSSEQQIGLYFYYRDYMRENGVSESSKYKWNNNEDEEVILKWQKVKVLM